MSVDAQGKFQIKGTVTHEQPGPVMCDGNPASQAMYSGTIQAQRCTFVTLAPDNEPYGEYVLVRGKLGCVVKCR